MGHGRKFKQMLSMLGRVKNSHYPSCYLLMGTAKDRFSVTVEVMTTRLTEPDARVRKSFLHWIIAQAAFTVGFTVLDGTKVSVEMLFIFY